MAEAVPGGVLVDSSSWIDYFRARGGAGSQGDAIDRLMDEGLAVICGMVELEILQGLKAPEGRRVQELLGALRFVETERQDFVSAGELLCVLRRKGVTIPASDGLIAAVCIRHGLRILTVDPHFRRVPGLAFHS